MGKAWLGNTRKTDLDDREVRYVLSCFYEKNHRPALAVAPGQGIEGLKLELGHPKGIFFARQKTGNVQRVSGMPTLVKFVVCRTNLT